MYLLITCSYFYLSINCSDTYKRFKLMHYMLLFALAPYSMVIETVVGEICSEKNS